MRKYLAFVAFGVFLSMCGGRGGVADAYDREVVCSIAITVQDAL
jgi:hypothetical protein